MSNPIKFDEDKADYLMMVASELFDDDPIAMAFHFAACVNGLSINDNAAMTMMQGVVELSANEDIRH